MLELNVSASQEEHLALAHPTQLPGSIPLVRVASPRAPSARIGQQLFLPLQAFVVMYSVTDRSYFERARYYLQLIRNAKGATQADAPPVILLGNKLDLLNEQGPGRSNDRVVSPAEVHMHTLSPTHWSLPPARPLADTPRQGQALADKHSAFSWGLDAGAETSEFRFTHNFFEYSVARACLVEYSLTALIQSPADADADAAAAAIHDLPGGGYDADVDVVGVRARVGAGDRGAGATDRHVAPRRARRRPRRLSSDDCTP
jgi:hypothetical protein